MTKIMPRPKISELIAAQQQPRTIHTRKWILKTVVPLEQRKAVKPEDYTSGRTFDIDGYAKVLGYTKLDAPKVCAVYEKKRNDTKCFVYLTQQVIFAIFDKNDGYAYQADPLAIPVSENAYLLNITSEAKQRANESGLRHITGIMSHLATTDTIDFSHLFDFESVFKLSGSPKYFSDGLPKEAGGERSRNNRCNKH